MSRPPTTSSASSRRAGSTSPPRGRTAPANYPRVLTLWRANLLGSSSKGHGVLPQARARGRGRRDPQRGGRPRVPPHPFDVRLARNQAPVGQAQRACCATMGELHHGAGRLRCTRTSSCRRQPGTRSTTSPRPTSIPSSTRSTPRFRRPGRTHTNFASSKGDHRPHDRALAKTHLGVRRDLVAAPLLHDTPDELAQPIGEGARLAAPESASPCRARRCRGLLVVERDYGAVLDKWRALGPLVEGSSASAPRESPGSRLPPQTPQIERADGSETA